VETSIVYIRHAATGEMAEATLFHQITEEHLVLWKANWLPVMHQTREELKENKVPVRDWPEDLHWDWDAKLKHYGGLMAYRTFCLICQEQVQGLMILDMTKQLARLPSQAEKPLGYIEFLATAPWNRKAVTGTPAFRGVGGALMHVAIQVSIEDEFQGRIGLHSLPRANDFYEKVCGMTHVGPDPKKQGLCYFEMTPEQAKRFRP
jgi:hypothetical protein